MAAPLSTREHEVLTLMASGHPNRAIAEKLFITVDTVKRHVTHVFEKLGVANRTQAVAQGARARAARLSHLRPAQVGCRRSSSARAASRATLVLRQSSGVSRPSPMSTRMQSRTAGGRSTSAGTASAERWPR